MERIIRYNVFFNYYRVFPQSLSMVLLFCVVTSSVLQMLMSSRVNKWSIHPNSAVFCLCLCFEFNPTPQSHIDSSIPNVTMVSQSLHVRYDYVFPYSTRRSCIVVDVVDAVLLFFSLTCLKLFCSILSRDCVE